METGPPLGEAQGAAGSPESAAAEAVRQERRDLGQARRIRGSVEKLGEGVARACPVGLCRPVMGRAVCRRCAMLFICEYTWQPKTTADQVRARMKKQHDEGTNHPERFKGYYGLAGGGGFSSWWRWTITAI
ncbi:MAG: hypothetical protein U0232_21110 [Thermomicrobiales bacterium]